MDGVPPLRRPISARGIGSRCRCSPDLGLAVLVLLAVTLANGLTVENVGLAVPVVVLAVIRRHYRRVGVLAS